MKRAAPKAQLDVRLLKQIRVDYDELGLPVNMVAEHRNGRTVEVDEIEDTAAAEHRGATGTPYHVFEGRFNRDGKPALLVIVAHNSFIAGGGN